MQLETKQQELAQRTSQYQRVGAERINFQQFANEKLAAMTNQLRQLEIEIAKTQGAIEALTTNKEGTMEQVPAGPNRNGAVDKGSDAALQSNDTDAPIGTPEAAEGVGHPQKSRTEAFRGTSG